MHFTSGLPTNVIQPLTTSFALRENALKTVAMVVLVVSLGFIQFAAAQQVDFAFGASAVSSTSAANAGFDYTPQSIGGGTFLGFSGDFLLRHNFGVQGELNWRAGRNYYFGFQPFRPLFWDFNAIWAPKISKRASAELLGGIGAESVRFYQGFETCSGFGCTDYTSLNHFMGDVGGGLKLYVTPHIFVRPEARLYLVRNNFEFSSGKIGRYGVSIGYTFGGSQ